MAVGRVHHGSCIYEKPLALVFEKHLNTKTQRCWHQRRHQRQQRKVNLISFLLAKAVATRPGHAFQQQYLYTNHMA